MGRDSEEDVKDRAQRSALEGELEYFGAPYALNYIVVHWGPILASQSVNHISAIGLSNPYRWLYMDGGSSYIVEYAILVQW